MTGTNSSMSCATDTKVKPCTLSRVGTATVRKTVAGCGSANGAMSSCYWTGYQTNLNEPSLFHCPANYVMSGVKSVHSNKREDRRWNFYCCIARGYCTKQCYWTNYINNWDGYMNYIAPHPWVFTGAFSHHSNKRE